MASTKKTPTLQLETYNASPLAKQVLFEEFRLAIANSDDSNMTKLDDFALETKEELSKKASKDVATTTKNGLMSSTDKTRVDNMWNGQAGNADVVAHNANPDAHPDKLQLNGTTTNVNFKRNEIVQDGLVVRVDNTNTPPSVSTKASINISNDFTIIVKAKKIASGTIFSQVQNGEDSSRLGIALDYQDATKSFRLFQGTSTGWISNTLESENPNNPIAIVKKGNIITMIMDRIVTFSRNINPSTNNTTLGGSGVSNTGEYNIQSYIHYNRSLTLQEIQHNFSVLNNPPSVNAIETTDSSSVKTSFLFATDSDHVEMPNGKTLREFAYQTLDWETKKSDGSDISVTNGKEAWVRNAKISGNTVKNLCPTINTSNVKDSGLSFVTIDSMKITVSCDGAQASNPDVKYIYGNIEPNKQYILRYLVYENTSNNIFDLNVGTSAIGVFSTTVRVGAGFTGVNEVVVTSKTDLSAATSLIRTYFPTSLVGKISYSVALFEVGAKTSDKIVPFGLTSTQAILTNNGLKYPIYKDATDKASDKVLDLGGLEGARNTLEILKDGSGIYVQNLGKYSADGNEDWKLNSLGTHYYFPKADITVKQNSLGACDKLERVNWGADTNDLGFTLSNGVMGLIAIRNASIVNDISAFKLWVKEFAPTFVYQLATPIITHIPASLVPTIITEQTNTFSVDSAVKPDGIEVTVAVDKISDLESRLKLLEAVMKSKSNLSSLFNYSEDEYEQNKNLETELI